MSDENKPESGEPNVKCSSCGHDKHVTWCPETFCTCYDPNRKFPKTQSSVSAQGSAQPQVVTLQQLCDAGLNGFALQLFVESVADKKDAATFTPLTISYKGILVTLAPDPNRPIDGRHQ